MRTLFRAAVMLTTLVGLPAAWIFFDGLPPSVGPLATRATAAIQQTLGLRQWPWERSGPQSSGAAAAATRAPVQLQPRPAPLPTPPLFDAPPLAATERQRSVASAPAARGPVAAEPSPSPAPGLKNQLEPLLAALRAHGADQYALRRWGSSGASYRFTCVMPLVEGGGAVREFEAIAVQPEKAVQQVLAEIDQWRASRFARRSAPLANVR